MNKYVVIGLELIIILLLLAIKYLNTPIALYVNGITALTVLHGFIVFVIVVDLLRRLVSYIYAKRKNLSFSQKNNFQFGVNNIAKFIIGLGLIIALFGMFGIDIRALLTSLSIVAAAIAIITKEYINDFLIGLYFSFSKDIEINDYVKIGDHKGRVSEIQMLKIKILNDDDDMVIIPNSKVYNSEIINYTKRDIRSLSIDFQISNTAIKNLELFEKDLIDSLIEYEEFLEPDSFNLKIVNMYKDSIDLKFQYTLKHLDRNVQRDIRKKTVRQVFNYISEKAALPLSDG